MDVTDAIITALRQLSEALEDVQRLQSCVETLNEGYKTIGQVPAARRVYSRISGFSYGKLNASYAHSIRHDFVERAPISSLTVAWQAYADRFDVQGLGISTELLEAGLALARLTRNCLAGSHEAKALVRLVPLEIRCHPSCKRRLIFLRIHCIVPRSQRL